MGGNFHFVPHERHKDLFGRNKLLNLCPLYTDLQTFPQSFVELPYLYLIQFTKNCDMVLTGLFSFLSEVIEETVNSCTLHQRTNERTEMM